MSAQGVVILGGGGHAQLLATWLRRAGYRVRGHVAPEPGSKGGHELVGDWLGDDAWLAAGERGVRLTVNGIGSTVRPDVRRMAFLSASKAGCDWLGVVHPGAIVDSEADVGAGFQALAGVVVQPGCSIGDNVLINTGAIVEHGARVADHSHIAPGACVCGGADIGENVHVGAGAIVLEGRVIASGAVIGAGAVINRDVSPNAVVVGNPAREIVRGVRHD